MPMDRREMLIDPRDMGHDRGHTPFEDYHEKRVRSALGEGKLREARDALEEWAETGNLPADELVANFLRLAASRPLREFVELLDIPLAPCSVDVAHGDQPAAVNTSTTEGGPGSWLSLSMSTFSKLLRDLVRANPYQPAPVRILLNMALDYGADTISIMPEDATQEEISEAIGGDADDDAYQGTIPRPHEKDAPHYTDESSSEDDASDVEGPSHAPTPVLHLVDCEAQPALNGTFELVSQSDVVLLNDHPAYRRHLHSADEGEEESFFIFYQEFSDVRVGWWIGPAYGQSEGLLGHCPSSASVPPTKGWHVASGESRTADSMRLFTSTQLEAWKVHRDATALSFLNRIDVKCLTGRVVDAVDPRRSSYFRHFTVLVHLDYLSEIQTVKRRLSRPVKNLTKRGQCLVGLKISKRGSRHGANTVVLDVPSGTTIDVSELAIKENEAVALSTSDPVKSFIAAAKIKHITSTSVTIDLSGVSSATLPSTLRLDKFANSLG